MVAGSVRLKEDLFKHTSIKIGGPAQIWVEPVDNGDLRKVLVFARVKKIKVFVIGNGSNILAKDEGFNGIVVSLSAPYFKKLKIKGMNFCVGAGHSLSHLVRTVCKLGLGGLESMVGIPGTVGGAIFMNAGGYSNPVYRNIGEFVTSVKVMDYGGVMHTLKRNDLEFGYRCSNISRYIILEANFRLSKTDRKVLISNCSHFLNIKRTKQALDLPSAGCAFKNPPGSQFTSGQMIDTLGLKGMRIGGAQISEIHANFIVNRGGATSKDVMAIVDLVQDKIKDNYGIDLELEIKVL
jgi:UDP-N-acetylmuramate dehydrogenase